MNVLKNLLLVVFMIPLLFIFALPYKIGHHYSDERIAYALGFSIFTVLNVVFTAPFITKKMTLWMESRKLKREKP